MNNRVLAFLIGATLLTGTAHAEDSAWAILDVRLGFPTKALSCTPKLVVMQGLDPEITCDYSVPGGVVSLVGSSIGEIVYIQRTQYVVNGDASPDMILEKAESNYGKPNEKEYRRLLYRNAEGDELLIAVYDCGSASARALYGGVCKLGPYDSTHAIDYILSNPSKAKKSNEDARKAAEEQKNGIAQDRLKTQRF